MFRFALNLFFKYNILNFIIMQKHILSLSSVLKKTMLSSAFLLFIFGCSYTEEENTTQKIDLKSKNIYEARFDSQLSNEKIIENYYADGFRYGTKTFLREHDFTLTEIVIKEEVVGYTIEDGISLQLGDIRFIESNKKLNLLDVSTSKMYIFDMVYSDEYGFSVPIFNDDYDYYYETEWGCGLSMSLCTTGCALGTIDIAASDGPLPLMDVVAAAFYIACNADCAVDYENCKAKK